MKLSQNRWMRHPSAVDEQVEQDSLVLDLETGRYFGLGEVGGFIWRQLNGSTGLEEIADKVSHHYEIRREQAVEDLRDFIARLHDFGLIQGAAG